MSRASSKCLGSSSYRSSTDHKVFQVLGIAMDDASKKDIAEFVSKLGIDYPILIGKEDVGDAYGGVQFLPATFYVGRDGKVVDKVFGLKGRDEIEDNIKKALGRNQ